MSKQLPRLEQIKALGPYTLRAVFSNERSFDVELEEFLRGYKIYAPLLNSPELFAAARLGEWGWDVVWPMPGGEDLDISASTLHRLALEQAGEAMPRDQFRAWRENQGLSLTGAAETLGLSRRMVAYYDSGERIIPKTVMLACKGVELERRRAS
jgi:hypothetical protein